MPGLLIFSEHSRLPSVITSWLTANVLRDVSRLEDCLKRMDEMPLGSCALAGTTYPIDRTITAELLGFERITNNSLDGVSDRDYCIDLRPFFQ